MYLSCFNCGWDKDVCYIHHIIPKNKSGSDDHTNLTILCPNCHRLAYKNKIICTKNIKDEIGDAWRKLCYVKHTPKYNHDNLHKSHKTRDINNQFKYNELIKQIKKSDIDFSKYGWVNKVSTRFNISHQHVSSIIKKYDLEFFNSCYRRI
jgi:predicted HNH restriction endonuclease